MVMCYVEHGVNFLLNIIKVLRIDKPKYFYFSQGLCLYNPIHPINHPDSNYNRFDID